MSLNRSWRDEHGGGDRHWWVMVVVVTRVQSARVTPANVVDGHVGIRAVAYVTEEASSSPSRDVIV